MGSAIDFLFDVEETIQSDFPRTSALKSNDEALEALAHRIELAARQTSEMGRQLYQNVTMLMGRFKADDKPSEALYNLASALVNMGYGVLLRHALGGGTNECFKSLRHEFLVVRGTGEFRGIEFIVEPSLRQHFAIPHPTPEYTFVLDRTPDIFVGGSCRLVSIVQLLCTVMAESFQKQGLTLPPWRREAAMLSKWMPQPSHIRDLQLGPTGSFAACSTTVMSSACQPQQQQQEEDDGAPSEANAICVLNDTTDSSNSLQTPGGDPSRLHEMLVTVPVDVFGASQVCAAPGCCPHAAVVVGFDVSEDLRTRIAAKAAGKGGEKGCNLSCCYTGSGSIEAYALPYTSSKEGMENKVLDDLDDCASSCEGPFAADEDANSFLLASETSGANSLTHEYDDTSLPSSPALSDAAVTLRLLCATGDDDDATDSTAFLPKYHRPTSTGMLPCRCLGTGMLSAKLLLGQLAAKTSSVAMMMMMEPAEPPPPSPPPAPQVYSDATAIQLVRMAAAKKVRITGSCCGTAAAAPIAPAFPFARDIAEWLPWGLPH